MGSVNYVITFIKITSRPSYASNKTIEPKDDTLLSNFVRTFDTNEKKHHNFLLEIDHNVLNNTRTRADQHKCIPHLACINPTLLCVEYF